MEEGDASALTPKPRRGGNSAIYEKYLNIKQNALSPVGAAAASPPKGARPQALPEISNSTDEQELEAGEVVSTQENDADANGLSVSDAADGKSEPASKPQPATESTADTPQSVAPAVAVASDSNQLTAVGTFCAADASADASAAAPDTAAAVVTPSPAAPLSPSAAAFERARAPALSNPSSPSRSPLEHPQYAGLRTPVRMTNNGLREEDLVDEVLAAHEGEVRHEEDLMGLQVDLMAGVDALRLVMISDAVQVVVLREIFEMAQAKAQDETALLVEA
ncbi:endocytosis defective- protein [Phytophthora boehmeriae]|uniref:Endocytosis defective- protein n=1 Tax=Phytophthora boehmeriae TaxID=109152 RepID=A0A8T1X849_9STRA|nr:endocytosis defective- protein [Phytophthora boehmeriae]